MINKKNELYTYGDGLLTVYMNGLPIEDHFYDSSKELDAIVKEVEDTYKGYNND